MPPLANQTPMQESSASVQSPASTPPPAVGVSTENESGVKNSIIALLVLIIVLGGGFGVWKYNQIQENTVISKTDESHPQPEVATTSLSTTNEATSSVAVSDNSPSPVNISVNQNLDKYGVDLLTLPKGNTVKLVTVDGTQTKVVYTKTASVDAGSWVSRCINQACLDINLLIKEDTQEALSGLASGMQDCKNGSQHPDCAKISTFQTLYTNLQKCLLLPTIEEISVCHDKALEEVFYNK